MCEFIRETRPIARKEHECMACVWLNEYGEKPGYLGMTLSDARKWVKARKDKYKIKKGEKYINVTQVHDGKIYDFKAKIEIDKLCRKYDLYQDDC